MELLKKFKGCFAGLACGDYLGMPVEFTHSREDVEDFFGEPGLRPVIFVPFEYSKRKPGYYTDDTCMAMCLAESLYENDFDIKDQIQRYKKWLFQGYNTPDGGESFGVGNHTFKILTSLDEDDLPQDINHKEDHGGNGALMRCAPIGLFYNDDISLLKENSFKSAIVTHNNLDSAWSCVVLNSFIAYSLLGHDKENFVNLFLAHYSECPENIKKLLLVDYQAMPANYCFDNSGFTLHSLQIVLYSFFRFNKFRETVAESIYMGGDADTQGAIAGALAGAYYGYDDIPHDWVNELINREYIEKQATNLHSKKYGKI